MHYFILINLLMDFLILVACIISLAMLFYKVKSYEQDPSSSLFKVLMGSYQKHRFSSYRSLLLA